MWIEHAESSFAIYEHIPNHTKRMAMEEFIKGRKNCSKNTWWQNTQVQAVFRERCALRNEKKR